MIYLDLVMALNFVVNFFLLKITGLIARRKAAAGRLAAASVLGAAYIIFFVLPPNPLIFSWIGKTLLPLGMVVLAFNPRNRSDGAIMFVLFYLCSFAMGGLVLAVSLWVDFPVYLPGAAFQLHAPSLPHLFLAGVLLYTAASRMGGVMVEKLNFRLPSTSVPVVIGFGGKRIKLSAFLDTGNMLKEPYSGSPVAVAPYWAVKELLPAGMRVLLQEEKKLDWLELQKFLAEVQDPSRYCLVPYRSLNEKGLLLAFRPETVELCRPDGRQAFKGGLTVAVLNGQSSAGADYEMLLPLEAWRAAGETG